MTTLTPQLFVEDMKRSIAFYTDVMGFEVRRADPVDAPTHASLQRGDSSIMLSPYGAEFEGWTVVAAALQRRGHAGAVSFYIEADDLEGEYNRAVAAGVTIVDPLATRPWGQREFTMADPDGFWWAVWKA